MEKSKVIQLALVIAFIFSIGCNSKPDLDKAPEEVEKRRQDFIQQSEREAEEALPPE